MTGYTGQFTEIGIIEETTWGTTPATPVFLLVRNTGESLEPGLETVTSNEVDPTAARTDVILVGSTASGGWSFEGTFDSAMDLLLEHALRGTFAANILKASNEVKSLTIEKKVSDGTTPYYIRYKGAKVSSYTITAEDKAIITGSVEFNAKEEEKADLSIIAGATYTAKGSSPVMRWGNLEIQFEAPISEVVCIKNWSITINNNNREQSGRCTDDTVPDISIKGVAQSMRDVTGDTVAYFGVGANKLKDALLDNDSIKATVTISDGTNGYKFTGARIKLSGGATSSASVDDDVEIQLSYQNTKAVLPPTWQAGTYNPGDIVEGSNNNVYRCNTTTTDDPVVDPTDWDLIGVDSDYDTDLKVEKF